MNLSLVVNSSTFIAMYKRHTVFGVIGLANYRILYSAIFLIIRIICSGSDAGCNLQSIFYLKLSNKCSNSKKSSGVEV